MYVYMVRSEYSNFNDEDVYNEAIFDSIDKAIQFINEWDLDMDDILAITRDETTGEELSYVRTIDYISRGMDESVYLFIDKYKVNSIICTPYSLED